MEAAERSTSRVICNDYELGINAFQAGDFWISAELLSKAVEIDPDNWDARTHLAFCYKKLNQHFKAQRALRFIAERCPIEHIRQQACDELDNARGPIET